MTYDELGIGTIFSPRELAQAMHSWVTVHTRASSPRRQTFDGLGDGEIVAQILSLADQDVDWRTGRIRR